jgi:hypothetical protein
MAMIVPSAEQTIRVSEQGNGGSCARRLESHLAPTGQLSLRSKIHRHTHWPSGPRAVSLIDPLDVVSYAELRAFHER